MKTSDIFHETYSALSANKVRTALTMLGIVIGIASVIAMVSIGNGAKAQIQSSIEGLGSNLLTILPGVVEPGRGVISSGRGGAQTLKNEDYLAIKNLDGVLNVSPEVTRKFQIVSSIGNNTNTTVDGVLPDFMTLHNLAIADGSFITNSDDRSLGREAVLGYTAATDLFGEEDALGKSIRINGVTFTITGILEKKGGAGFGGPDDMVFVPLSTMEKILSGADYLSDIVVSVTDKNIINDVRDSIVDLLSLRHHVKDPDFSIISQDDILGALSTIISTFTIFLAAIASISLLVGGIGIMNMMLTTVNERTKEIGLRKAIGAKSQDISRQFLAEAVMLTGGGGIIGIFLGWLVAFGVSKTGIVQTEVSFFSIALAFGVSTIIGIIFGYYPAMRAAKLNPIEALRYE